MQELTIYRVSAQIHTSSRKKKEELTCFPIVSRVRCGTRLYLFSKTYCAAGGHTPGISGTGSNLKS
jgi:hypothetical protein